MDLKRLRHKLVERQHSQTLPGLGIRVPSLHTCAGSDWALVKRCCSGSSSGQGLPQEQELLDSGIPEEDFGTSPVAKRNHKALDGVAAHPGVPGMKIGTAHITNSALEGVIVAPGMPGSRFDTVHIANCALDDLSNSKKFATINDYVTECWDEDLEDAIIRCSDASMLDNRFENAGTENHKVDMVVDAAMPDMRRDDVLGVALASPLDVDLRSISTQSTNIKVEDVVPNTTIVSSYNVGQLSSHCQEDFDPHYEAMDRSLKEEGNELSGDDLLSHPDDIPLKFSQQQMDVLEAVACGKSVFITGSAGTGKSFLLMYIIRMLQKAIGRESVYVTASTGLAACALNGTTLHSFAGIRLGGGTAEDLAGRVFRSKESKKRWKAAQVLVIDEISMINGDLFDKLEYVARKVRGIENCFGGIQLVVTGDFFQLPPVNPPNRHKYFAFESECWNSCFDLQVELEHVFRQSDSTFVKMLNEIRKGLQSPETLNNLSMCHRALPDDGTEIAPTRLYPLKVDVRFENMQELKALETNIITFYSVDSAPNPLHRYMLDSMRAEKELQLCVGAQVMLIKNIDTCVGLVNGAKGVVIGFESTYNMPVENEKDEERKQLKSVSHLVSPNNLWPVVRFNCGVRTIGPKKEHLEDGGVEVVSRTQVPLILAWALSVHKCQGMTLSKVQTDLSKAFEFGMVYVALSRVKDLDGLQLIGFDPTRIKVHPNVVAFFDKLIEKA